MNKENNKKYIIFSTLLTAAILVAVIVVNVIISNNMALKINPASKDYQEYIDTSATPTRVV